ncbi:MAG TPA: PLxRFG domain-containing protein [Fluviicoccus sp.]|nr:PLxRFG domain-containing protein [Fluviicoccus sp.]
MLNNRQLKITFRDQENKTHVDLEATEKANDIAKKMRERFSTWLWTDPKRAERLVSYYNENFNNIAPRKFDGSHLTLPGVSALIQLRPHQKRAIWRVIQQGDSYLAHAVGAGKTMEMIGAGMEERRLGLVNKPMYVVPNHMLAQFSREFLELYPAANIMVADEQNFHTHNRKRFVAQAALNNPDAIIITHSAFGRIGMSDEFYTDFMQRQIDDWKAALEDADSSDRVTVKQIERRIEQLEQRMEGRQNRDKKDQVLTFEELGVDKLYVDEFHEFRKLDFATNQGNVKGVDPNGSQRALDLFMKVEYLRGKKPGRALVAASGTPVTNTMGELYTAQRFFQPEQMKEDGLESFDAWANQYGDIVTGFEQNAAGGYEMVARFAKFQNVPELMRRVRSFMDILTSSNLGELVKRPDVVGGGRKVEVTPSPAGYKEFQQGLQKRIEAIKRRKGPPKKGEDIILNVIGDGRFSAIDMRFVDPTLPSDPDSKLNQMIDDLIAAYKETATWEYAAKDGKVEPLKGSTLMVFTDIGLGEQSAASRGFDMRGWIEKRLTDAGIPREHIAFMRDYKQHAKKERMFSDMREGKKRILIGGKEMETGTNVQKRLSHLFHLDAPWFPASVEQREGRAVRQGNQNREVVLKAYATKGSYDSTMWGMNARKARFIEQAMNGDDSVRSMEDVSEASAFEMAAALASGDERYMKLAGLKADVDRLERLRHAHYDDQNRLMREKHWAEEQIKRNTARVQELDKAIAKRQPIKAGEFEGKVGKTTYDSREEFSQALFKEFQDIAGTGLQDEREVGEIGGFPIKFYGLEMKGGTYAASLHVDLPDDPDPLLTFPLDPDTAVSGIATRAANQVNGLDKQRADAQGYIDSAKAKVEQASKRLGAPFPEEALLLEKVAELNSLEAELAAESKENNADAAAATVAVEGTTEQADAAADAEPRYSVNAEGQAVGEFGPVTEDFRNDPAGAIQYLQQQRTGEAIIDHPKLGEISLIWGDGKMGLSHIAARRGEDFLPRIAAILQETDVYEKSNQIGRVFLGNESDEATIRLDWNGQAKAWLVSAYEKYGDAKQSTQPEPANRSEVVRQRSGKLNVDDLRSEITTGVIGPVVARMIDNGQIVLHQNAETMPKAARGKKGVQAVTLANGQIHLVANRLTRDNARPVLLHEMFHMGGEALVGSKEWGNLMGRLGSLYRQAELSSGKAREFFDRARDRVAAARQQGAVSTGMTVEEFGAYAVEEWEQNRDSLPAVIRKWVEDLIGHIKAYVLARYGKQLGDVTPAQLAGMAKLVIMNAAVMAERGQLSGVTGKFSVAEDSKELDAAAAALDAPKVKDDYIGRVLGDMSLGARLLVHPRTVAAVHKEFTPVYRTAISQMETRDKFIADFGADVKAYDHLDQQGKEKVNKALELGRLTSSVYTPRVLADGIGNTGEKTTVVMVAGKPFLAKEPIHALLTEVGEVVKLNEQEIKAYQDLRRMFDRALDKMRDVTLEEMGFGEFAGEGNAAKKIIATIDDKTPPEKAERIKNIAAFVSEIEQAKRAGYVPFARYGDYVVTVKEKVADVSFVEDDKDHYIAKGLPDSFAPELVEMGAERNAEGWRIKKSQKQDVERLTEKTIYSTKVETGLGDILDERRAGKVDDIKAVKEAIDKARAEWVEGHPNRRIVAFKTREKKTDQPVKLSDVDALAEVANIDNGTWDAVRDKLADAIKAKGFRRHFFHSDNVPGYTGDFERSIADYVIGMSGYLSRRQHMKRWENAVSGINEKPKLFEYASKYRNYVNDPQEELAMVKQIGFFSYIAGVLASAFANLTQVPLMTLPTLGQVAPMPLLTKEIGRAYKDAARMISPTLEMFDPNKAPADVRDILKEAWAEGSFVPLESFDLMMTARQRNVGARKGVKAFNKATQIIALGFTFAERMNRLVTFIAAARVAQKRAVQENANRVLAGDALARAEVLRNWNPKSFAEWAVDESQYRMGKANRPSVMRGVGSTIMQFKGFMLQTMEAWYRMAALHGKEGKYAAAASLLALYSLSGLWGLPGADDLRELLESIYKTITGKDMDLKTELRAWIARTSGSNALSQMVTKGASYPLGVDLTRVGMGSIVPDSPLAAAGIPFDMLIGRPKRAFEKMSAGDELGALGELSPNFIKHWLVSGSWALEGVRDKQGNLILAPDELGNGDLAMKAIGFQPSIVTDVRDYEYAQRRQETAVDGLKRSYTNKLAKAMVRLETASPEEAPEIEQEIDDIYADINEHNDTAAPEEVIKIGTRALRNKMMRERDGVKGTWGRERKQGRQAAEELRGVFGLQAGEEDDE